jgi:hypothetical protein
MKLSKLLLVAAALATFALTAQAKPHHKHHKAKVHHHKHHKHAR